MKMKKIIYFINIILITTVAICSENQTNKLNSIEKTTQEKKEINKKFTLIQEIINNEKNFLTNYINYGGEIRIKNKNTQQFTNKEYIINFSVPGIKILKKQLETFFINVEKFFVTELQEIWNYNDFDNTPKKLNLDSKIKEFLDEIKGEALEPKLAFTIKMYLCCEFICGEIINELLELFKITHLDLSNNDIYYLPFDYKGLDNLEVLKLNKNKLRQVPIYIYKYINLKILELNSNLLKNIGETIFLKNLQLLDVGSNLIEKLPKTTINLINLKTLIIDNNLLTTIPNNFLELPKLSVIDLHDNPKNSPLPVKLSDKILDKDKFQVIIGAYDLKTEKTPILR